MTGSAGQDNDSREQPQLSLSDATVDTPLPTPVCGASANNGAKTGI